MKIANEIAAAGVLSLLLLAGCASTPPDTPVLGTVSGDRAALLELEPVDVAVLPIRNETSVAVPLRVIDEQVRKHLLDKYYSVLSREHVAARYSATEVATAKAGYTPGTCDEQAVLEVVVTEYSVASRGPIKKVRITADFQFLGADAARTVLWSFKGAQIEIPTDGYPESILSRKDVQERALARYIDMVFAHFPEKPPLGNPVRYEDAGPG